MAHKGSHDFSTSSISQPAARNPGLKYDQSMKQSPETNEIVNAVISEDFEYLTMDLRELVMTSSPVV